MKVISGFAVCFALLLSHVVKAESLRCNGDIVEVGDAKVDVYRKCGEPVLKDSYCERTPIKIKQSNGNYDLIERCENIDVWTYNPGKGQFWTNLYFSQGRLREMRYGDRVE
ncbi:hypothetical protein GCM10011613_13050 [Cellvibrio zantedeschiae]|uniref:DUF2845 domain-containing protein n=1 Tax=Cellvibrio zantedeschiae TaxID=1237077 RepID=A0ABQ3AXM7_9GAMM|nr:DUF2845 domain-containing protein [Cellvibrio zantedeschiae]GGY70047.1 hypothetical protein GCM10011613_13050 [Cellvibrio zantedeschiae]